jgi:hypothetical protein
MFATSANTYDYRWYQEGRYLAFVQRQQESIYDPYYSVREDIYRTPFTSDSSAILVRYTVPVTVPTAETTDLGVSREIAMGLVHYVKYKLLEDKDANMARWHYNKFLYYVERHNKNYKGKPPIRVMPALNPGALR